MGPLCGRGKFSKVVLGVHIPSGRKCALKILKRGSRKANRTVRRVADAEVRALCRVRHKHVVELINIHWNADYPHRNGRVSKAMVIALEYMPNGELLDYLIGTGVVNERVARTFFQQLIGAVRALHKLGIAHRDLKPGNLLLDARWNLKVADFGLCKIIETDSDAMRTSTGTIRYMAPEQASGRGKREYTPACDIWSCGVILFEMRLGRSPYAVPFRRDPLFNWLYLETRDHFWKFHNRTRPPPDGKQTSATTNPNAGPNAGPSAGPLDPGLSKDSVKQSFRDLIDLILTVPPSERAGLDDIERSSWFKEAPLPPEEVARILRDAKTKEQANRAATQPGAECTTRENDGGQGDVGLSTHYDDPLSDSSSSDEGFCVTSHLSERTLVSRLAQVLRSMRSDGVSFDLKRCVGTGCGGKSAARTTCSFHVYTNGRRRSGQSGGSRRRPRRINRAKLARRRSNQPHLINIIIFREMLPVVAGPDAPECVCRIVFRHADAAFVDTVTRCLKS